VLDAKRITSHEAKRRQLQYIGRLMREVDPEPIRARSPRSKAARRRPRPRTGGSRRGGAPARRRRALTDFASEHPRADLQEIRSLIRSARKEQKEGKPPRAYRELFRVLKTIETAGSLQG
jgi:ribosome-associated protein